MEHLSICPPLNVIVHETLTQISWVDYRHVISSCYYHDHNGRKANTNKAVGNQARNVNTLNKETFIIDKERAEAVLFCMQMSVPRTGTICWLKQWSSAWDTRGHHRWYKNTFYEYFSQTETQKPFETWTSSDPRTHEDSSPNWGASMPETSSFVSLAGHNHINNW
jgi:hypothetical protein